MTAKTISLAEQARRELFARNRLYDPRPDEEPIKFRDGSQLIPDPDTKSWTVSPRYVELRQQDP